MIAVWPLFPSSHSFTSIALTAVALTFPHLGSTCFLHTLVNDLL